MLNTMMQWSFGRRRDRGSQKQKGTAGVYIGWWGGIGEREGERERESWYIAGGRKGRDVSRLLRFTSTSMMTQKQKDSSAVWEQQMQMHRVKGCGSLKCWFGA